jgi:hypothetical protein
MKNCCCLRPLNFWYFVYGRELQSDCYKGITGELKEIQWESKWSKLEEKHLGHWESVGKQGEEAMHIKELDRQCKGSGKSQLSCYLPAFPGKQTRPPLWDCHEEDGFSGNNKDGAMNGPIVPLDRKEVLGRNLGRIYHKEWSHEKRVLSNA